MLRDFVVTAPAPNLRVLPGGAGGEPSELSLLRAFFEGDQHAFSQLFRLHQDTVYRVVRRFAKSHEDARDLTQRAFLAAFEHAAKSKARFLSGEVETPFKAWVLRVAVNFAKNHARDTGRWALAPLDTPGRHEAVAPQAHDAVERQQTQELVRRAVLELPPRQREVFSLRIDGGLPFGEIAQALDITEGNAKACFHYAVKRIKEEVSKQEAV